MLVILIMIILFIIYKSVVLIKQQSESLGGPKNSEILCLLVNLVLLEFWPLRV